MGGDGGHFRAAGLHLVGEGVEVGLLAAAEDHFGPEGGVGAGDGLADALAGSGDEGDFVLEGEEVGHEFEV